MKSRRAARPRPPHSNTITLLDDSAILTDRSVSARVRRRERERRRVICREAERLMPLVRYYGPQPLLAVPLGEIYARGRWAA